MYCFMSANIFLKFWKLSCQFIRLMKNRSPCLEDTRQTKKWGKDIFTRKDVGSYDGAMVVSSSSPLVNVMVE